MRRRRTNRYHCQARTVAGGALLSSVSCELLCSVNYILARREFSYKMYN